jgi:hypothetical protein
MYIHTYTYIIDAHEDKDEGKEADITDNTGQDTEDTARARASASSPADIERAEVLA